MSSQGMTPLWTEQLTMYGSSTHPKNAYFIYSNDLLEGAGPVDDMNTFNFNIQQVPGTSTSSCDISSYCNSADLSLWTETLRLHPNGLDFTTLASLKSLWAHWREVCNCWGLSKTTIHQSAQAFKQTFYRLRESELWVQILLEWTLIAVAELVMSLLNNYFIKTLLEL